MKRWTVWAVIAVVSLGIGCMPPIGEDPITPDQVPAILAIPGVTPPVYGVTPAAGPIDTTYYTGTISWDPAGNPFAATTVYTATITITPKAGYTLNGVPANSFTVAGADTVTHAAGSGVVTAVFPATLDFKLTLVTVPAGRFQRDATTTNISVITQPYRMSQYEITRAQFQAILGTDPSNATYSYGSDNPVQMTNWYHAIAFCNKLSLAEGLTPVYAVSGITDWAALTYSSIPTSDNADWNAATATWTNNGYRLPTEMEWMWAAMGAPGDGQGGGTNTTGYTKAFAGSTGSNAIDDYAWYSNNSSSKTHPAGTKTANELGLYDMSGNVLEWTWDWYTDYPTGPQTDYRGVASGTYRVARGGGYSSNASYFPLASRYLNNPNIQYYNFGFRVVRN